jgi:RNA polymerase sigma factor (TIGR02999 family)
MKPRFSEGNDMVPASEEVTDLLEAWSDGDPTALAKLTPLVYGELNRLARTYMRGEPTGHTLQSAALINEAYLRLIGWKNVRWQNRAHFIGVAARMMRRTLVDYARSSHRAKRGGSARRVSLDEAAVISEARRQRFVALRDALQSLERLHPRKSKTVELRYFAGLSVEETAAVLKVSPRTVMRDCNLARAWLCRELGGTPRNGAGTRRDS